MRLKHDTVQRLSESLVYPAETQAFFKEKKIQYQYIQDISIFSNYIQYYNQLMYSLVHAFDIVILILKCFPIYKSKQFQILNRIKNAPKILSQNKKAFTTSNQSQLPSFQHFFLMKTLYATIKATTEQMIHSRELIKNYCWMVDIVR